MKQLVLLAVFSCGFLASCAHDDEAIAQRDRKYNEAQAKIAGLTRQLEQLQSVDAASEAEAANTRAQIAALEAERARLAAELDAARRAPPPVAKPAPTPTDEFSIQTLSNGDIVMTLPNRVTFESGSAVLSAEGRNLLLGPVMAEIKKRPDLLISIEGHSDDQALKPELAAAIGDNTNLSVLRANSVRTLLSDSNAALAKRIRVVGYGEHRPRASGRDEASRALNRRVEIVLLRGN